jgi:hypothetical protein
VQDKREEVAMFDYMLLRRKLEKSVGENLAHSLRAAGLVIIAILVIVALYYFLVPILKR